MAKIASQNKIFSVTLSKLVKNNDEDSLKIMDNENDILVIQEKMEYEYPGYIVEVEEVDISDA